MTEDNAFKHEYITHIKMLILNDALADMRKTNFAAFIDRVTDVFEYMVSHFDESRCFLTPKFKETARTTANGNLIECKKMCALRDKPHAVLERLEYLSLLLERFLSMLNCA